MVKVIDGYDLYVLALKKIQEIAQRNIVVVKLVFLCIGVLLHISMPIIAPNTSIIFLTIARAYITFTFLLAIIGWYRSKVLVMRNAELRARIFKVRQNVSVIIAKVQREAGVPVNKLSN